MTTKQTQPARDAKARYEPEHLERWSADGPTGFDSAANYVGADLSDFYVAPVSVTRDSGLLERSNWEVVTKHLSEVATSEASGAACLGHWACGHYELFLIHRDDAPALEAADEWACALESYPVADESHFSEMEWDAVAEYWDRASLRERIEALARCDLSIFAARRDEFPSDPTGSFFSYLSEGL